MTGTGRVVPFSPEHVPGVRAFNARLAQAGAPWRFPESATPDWLARTKDASVWQEYFVVAEPDGGSVHGAYALKRQEAALRGTRRRVGSFYWPLSEGSINSAYALVATRMLSAAAQLEPLLFLIGMGGMQTHTARFVHALGWRLAAVPFYFMALHPVPFLRRLQYARKHSVLARLFDIAAATGLGWMVLKLAHAAVPSLKKPERRLAGAAVDRFGEWADAVWVASAAAYSFLGVRDATALNATYPPRRDAFVRLCVSRGGEPIGWAIVEDKRLAASPSFGDLHVGTIVDCLARPGDASAVIEVAVQFLAARGVDVLISNQSHHAWRRALIGNGFIRGPSTWILGVSPELARIISEGRDGAAGDPDWRELHMNRGDGDGPWGTDIANVRSPLRQAAVPVPAV